MRQAPGSSPSPRLPVTQPNRSGRIERLRQHAILGRLFEARVVGALVLFGLLGAIAALFIGTKLEEDNQFCGSCHTEPEVTYLSRFASALATSNADDLASYHHRQLYPRNSPSADYIRCIDCHVGEGILGRGIVLSLAAWDAVK